MGIRAGEMSPTTSMPVSADTVPMLCRWVLMV
jgi:hypothetical protein